MAQIRVIKKRIKSATNIAQITKAMQMVAASRMRRAQDQAIKAKPYQAKIIDAVRELAGKVDITAHPLLQIGNPDGATLVIVVATNKGMCGGLNNNLFRKIVATFPTDKKMQLVSLGKKAQSFGTKSGYQLTADFSSENYLDAVPAITDLFVKGFLNGEYGKVYIAFNRFVSALRQEPTVVQILPLKLQDDALTTNTDTNPDTFAEFLIEPSIASVLNALLPHYIEIQVRNAMLESYASEHSARMIAMKNATDNAHSLIDDLTLSYNRLRQEKITYEIADIVTAQLS